MTSRLFMNVQAGILGITGVVLLFVPELAARGMPSGVPDYFWSQAAAAAIIAFAAQNWMGRNAVFGGIYGKPIVFANMAFGLITALALLKMTLDTETSPAVIVLLVVFSQYGIGYAVMLVRGPGTGRGTDVGAGGTNGRTGVGPASVTGSDSNPGAGSRT